MIDQQDPFGRWPASHGASCPGRVGRASGEMLCTTCRRIARGYAALPGIAQIVWHHLGDPPSAERLRLGAARIKARLERDAA